MRLVARKRFSYCLLAVFAGLVGLLLMQSLVKADDGADFSSNLITIYDRGEKRVIRTDAPTVSAVLEMAEIELDDNDRVEPAMSEEILSADFKINIFRARPVVVIDGLAKVKVVTAEADAREVVEAAGVELYKEDEVEMELTGGLVETGVNVAYVVKRSKVVKLLFYGEEAEVRTNADTVGEFLEERQIGLAADDFVSLDKNAVIEEGLYLEVWRNGKNLIVAEEEIDFEVEQTQDQDREEGYVSVTQVGEKGSKTVTYEVEMVDGKETGRVKIGEVVTKPAVVQKEIIGVKAKVRYLEYTGGGDKTEWMRAAGIPESEWGYVDFIVQRESSWNPNARNKSSGACGLAQALPCSKVPGNPYDPVDSLRWQYGYVTARYGGYRQAYEFWLVKHWY